MIYGYNTFFKLKNTRMTGWKVTTVDLPCEINTHDKLERFMSTRFTLTSDFLGTQITLRPGSIKQLGKKFFGGGRDDGLGDMYLVRVDKQFMGTQEYSRRRGTKDSWSMFILPSKYLKDGSWNRSIPQDIKTKLKKVLEYIYMNGEFRTTVKTSGGSWSGNTYRGSTDGPCEHVHVMPAENKVTIPEYTKYGMPKNTFTDSSYDKQPYYTFVKNAPIIKDMDAETHADLMLCYGYLCDFSNHRTEDAFKLGQYLKLLDEGGFKYMVHKNYSGGVHIVEELAYCTMKIGTPPYYNKAQLPIKSGAAEHLPACILGASDFEDVSIDAIKNWGVCFEMYSAVKPGKLYIFSRQESTGIKHYWAAPALIAGGFIYRPKSGVDCLNYGCAIFPFATNIEEQKKQGEARNETILPRCVNCFKDNCATIGFSCRGHKHLFLCDSPECSATKRRFATGSRRGGRTAVQMFVCPICRMEHDSFMV